ncbi:MAG: menaquinone biosynthesis protein [Planctomycetota bacterium]
MTTDRDTIPHREPARDDAPLRVGTVPYLVGRPLDVGLEDEPGIDLRYEVPALLVEDLRRGDLDVALVSSIELFRRPGYRFIDGIAVCGESYVGSVQVFLRKPIQEVESIALDPSSRAAAALTRTLLDEREGGPPKFLEVPLGEDPRAVEGADAWLRIGDAALRETLTLDIPAWNPSEEWRRRTGMPFVFAAWIVREDAPIEPHIEAFTRARARGRASIGDLAREASERWSLPESRCLEYLEEECSYDPGAAMAPSLAEFRRRAAQADLCNTNYVPDPIAPTLSLDGALD